MIRIFNVKRQELEAADAQAGNIGQRVAHSVQRAPVQFLGNTLGGKISISGVAAEAIEKNLVDHRVLHPDGQKRLIGLFNGVGKGREGALAGKMESKTLS